MKTARPLLVLAQCKQRYPLQYKQRQFSLAVTISSKSSVDKEQWKWRSNYFKDWWNRETFGPVLDTTAQPRKSGKAKSRLSDIDTVSESNTAHWMRNLTFNEKRLRAHKSLGDGELKLTEDTQAALEDAISAASFALEEERSVEKCGRSDSHQLQRHSYDNPDKPTYEVEKHGHHVFRHLRGSLSYETVSVTTVLKETMPQESVMALQRWREKMIGQMGKEAFERFQERTLLRGKQLHSYIEQKLLGTEMKGVVNDATGQNLIRSIDTVLPDFSRPLALESHVTHPVLGYHGYVDGVVLHKGSNLVLVDWKTSEKRKPDLRSTFENPIQVRPV